jgi:hypothetical protein
LAGTTRCSARRPGSCRRSGEARTGPPAAASTASGANNRHRRRLANVSRSPANTGPPAFLASPQGPSPAVTCSPANRLPSTSVEQRSSGQPEVSTVSSRTENRHSDACCPARRSRPAPARVGCHLCGSRPSSPAQRDATRRGAPSARSSAKSRSSARCVVESVAGIIPNLPKVAPMTHRGPERCHVARTATVVSVADTGQLAPWSATRWGAEILVSTLGASMVIPQAATAMTCQLRLLSREDSSPRAAARRTSPSQHDALSVGDS